MLRKTPKNEFLNMQFHVLNTRLINSLHWCVDNSVYTRVRKVAGCTQKSTIDQITLSEITLINNLKVLPPLGKSDHVGLVVALNTKTDKRLIKKQ